MQITTVVENHEPHLHAPVKKPRRQMDQRAEIMEFGVKDLEEGDASFGTLPSLHHFPNIDVIHTTVRRAFSVPLALPVC